MEIRTREEKDLLLDYIQTVRNGIYTEKGVGEALREIPLPYSKVIKEELGNSSLKNTDAIKKALDKMEEKINSVKQINITLSFKPSEVFINNMHRWLKRNLGEDLIINLSEDENLLGGIILSYNGLYSDLSINKKLEELSFNQLNNGNI